MFTSPLQPRYITHSLHVFHQEKILTHETVVFCFLLILTLIPSQASAGAFVRDSTAWQNMSYGAYVAEEMGRDNTWPFIAGAVVTYILLGVMLPGALPASTKKDSKYMQMIEGNKDHH